MNTIWKLWVTLTLLYLLLASHRGEVVSGVRAGFGYICGRCALVGRTSHDGR
jgi:sulfopyruvate decarboxylase TPP-binding subunit